MNTDRFLTRVFDRQEKKMIYVGDTFKSGSITYVFKGLDKDGIIAYFFGNIGTIPFRHRFVPMMCQGWNDKNGKLIWEADIINDDIGTGVITLHEASNYLKIVYPKQDLGKWFIDFLESEKKNIEIIGNKFENEKLLEVKA